MRNFAEMMHLSARELKNTRALTLLAMLTALDAVLGLFTIPIGDYIRIGFGYLPIAVAGYYFGPIPGMMMGAVADVLQYLIKPSGAYFPGYTLSAMMVGFIFGVFLYRQKPTFRRIFFSRLLSSLLFNFGLNSLWIYLTIGTPLPVLLTGRGLKALCSFPVELFLLFLILSFATRFAPSFKRSSL